MVTLMILAFGMLASMVGIMAALDHSLMDEMRNDAMKLAQEQLEIARNSAYLDVKNIPQNQTIPRQVRKTTVNYNVNFQLTATVGSPTTTALSLLQSTVTWNHKGPMDAAPRQYSCLLQTIVRQTK
jgi:hypothetical protein